jgi:hypothetical protein
MHDFRGAHQRVGDWLRRGVIDGHSTATDTRTNNIIRLGGQHQRELARYPPCCTMRAIGSLDVAPTKRPTLGQKAGTLFCWQSALNLTNSRGAICATRVDVGVLMV